MSLVRAFQLQQETLHTRVSVGAFLRHLKCMNHPGYEAQSCSTQKVGFSKWRPFFDSMYFRLSPLPSGGFIQKILNEQEFHLTRGI